MGKGYAGSPQMQVPPYDPTLGRHPKGPTLGFHLSVPPKGPGSHFLGIPKYISLVES